MQALKMQNALNVNMDMQSHLKLVWWIFPVETIGKKDPIVKVDEHYFLPWNHRSTCGSNFETVKRALDPKWKL